MRKARDFFIGFDPRTFEDYIAAMTGPQSAYVRMVVSYWEQACALLNYGLLHEDLFFETSGEFFGIWERIKPTIEAGRKQFSSKIYLAHLEKAAKRYESWIEQRSPGNLAAMRKMMEQMRPKSKVA